MAVITGTLSSETLQGTAAADTLQGLDGNDILIGGAGADILEGGAGEDTASYSTAASRVQVYLSGGGSPVGDAAGDTYFSVENVIGSGFDDYISGNGQNNKLYGGAGMDSLYGFGSLGSTSRLFGEAGDDTLIGGAGIDIMDGGEGENTVSYFLSTAGVTVSLADNSLNTGDAAGDTYTSIHDVIGTNFNDVLRGNSNSLNLNQLQGQSGNDILYGAGAYAVLIGGEGADELHGGTGGNEVDYETATSGLTASLANTALNTGDAAGDTYIGLFGADLAGSAYNDVLYGDAGNNNILGDPLRAAYGGLFGNDALYGGDGDDTLDGGGGADALDGGAGIDAAAYTDALAGVSASLGNPGSNTGDAVGDTYVGIENLIGSAFNDTLEGDGASNTLFGDAGADALRGGGGDDLLEGGAGADALDGGMGFDYAIYSESAIGLTISFQAPQFNTGNAAGDTYASIEGVIGSSFADQIFGGAGNDTLQGAGGNDSLIGNEGDDTLIGGAGADTLSGSAGHNIASYSTASAGVIASLANTALNTGDAAGDTYQYIQQLDGSYFNDTLYADDSYGVTLRGLDGNDTLRGGNGGGNMLNGDAGADTLIGGTGDDTLVGGAGADSLDGGGGIDLASYVTSTTGVTASLGAPAGNTGDAVGDTYVNVENLAGTTFADTLSGNAASNVLFGLAGNDTLNGGDGDDLLEGGVGGDALRGDGGFDYASYTSALVGVAASLAAPAQNTGDAAGDTYVLVEGLLGSGFGDTLTGDAGVNVIQGLGGDDTIYGGAGSDLLLGGDGDDIIVGGDNGDQLTGGAGVDIFRYLSASDSVSTSLIAPDVINDFVSGTDKIDVSALSPSNYTIGQADGYTTLQVTAAGGAVLTVRLTAPLAASDLILSNPGQTYTGGAGTDVLTGGAGADTLIGGGGGDALTGGGGNDIFRYTAATDSKPDAYDIITDFTTGSDLLDLVSVTPIEVSLVTSGATTFVFVNSPGGQMTIAANGQVNGRDVLVHNTHGFYMIGDGAANTLVGGANGDVIQSGAGNDVIIGGLGGDVIFGEAGNDTFKYLTAAESNASGPDALFVFETAVDKIDLSAVAPTEVSLIRSGGSTFLFANTAGGPMQLSTVGYDLNAHDLITGMSNGIFMIGDDTANTLNGDELNDVIQAGGGNDIIWARGGGDAIWGGAGADVFMYQRSSESSTTAADTIFDFQSGVDKIDLTSARVGASAALGVVNSGGSTFIFVDVHGDGVTDMTIQLNGTASIANGDILF